MEVNKVIDMRILRRLYGSEGCEWMKGVIDFEVWGNCLFNIFCLG